MDKNKLASLLKKQEGPKLDYKLLLKIGTNGEKKELCRDISAIANTHGGRGYIIFGVEDKTKKVVGIEIEKDSEEKIQQIISSRIEPPIPIRMEYVEYEGKIIGILTVFKSEQRPHQIRENGTFYLRRGSTTDVARRYELVEMLQDSGVINFELVPVYNAKVDEIDEKLVFEYCKKINLKEDMSIHLLENLGICIKTEEGKYHPSVGGLLVFGRYPQKHLVGASLRIINNLNRDSEVKIFQGNIIYILDEAQSYLKLVLNEYVYPIEGLFEALTNSLVHRDYFDSGREIVMYLGYDKIEISNPGMLNIDDSMTSIANERNPFRRNNWIYQRLIILDDKLRFLGSGMGLNKIKKEFEDMGNVRFINLLKRNLFRVIFPGIKR